MENDLLFTNKFIKTYDESKKVYNKYPSNRFRNYIENKKRTLKSNIIQNVNQTNTISNLEKNNKVYQKPKNYTINNEILINIESSKRDSTEYPNANNYKIKLNPPIKNVKKIEMVSSEFPNTEQLIRGSNSNSQNNLVQFRLLKDFQFGIGNKIYKTELFPGNYTSNSLTNEFTLKMNDLKKKYDNKNFEFVVNIDEISDNVNISLIKSEFGKFRTINDETFFDDLRLSTLTRSKDMNFEFIENGTTYFNHDIEKGDKFYILGSLPLGFIPSSVINGKQYIKSVPNQGFFKIELPFVNKIGIQNGAGDLLKFGIDEKFQLLFNNDTCPRNILGFPKQDTRFKENHNNLISFDTIYNIITGVFLDEDTNINNMMEFHTFETHTLNVGDKIYIEEHLKVYDEFNEVNYIIPSTSYADWNSVNSFNTTEGISGISSGTFDSNSIGNNEFIITNVTNSQLYGNFYYDNQDDATTVSDTIYKGQESIRNGFNGSVEQLNINYSLMELTIDSNVTSYYHTSIPHGITTNDKILITSSSSITGIDITNDIYTTPVIINTTTLKLNNDSYNQYYIAKAYQFSGSTISGTTHTFNLTLDRNHNFYENDLVFLRLNNSGHNLENAYVKVSKSYYNDTNVQVQPLNTRSDSGTYTDGYLIENSITKYDIICSTLYKSDKTLQTTGGDSFYLRFFTYEDHDLTINDTNKIYIKNHRISRLLDGINQSNGHTIVEVPDTNRFRIQYPHSFNDPLQPLTSVTYTKYGQVSKKKVNNLIDLSGDDYILLTSPQLSSFDKNNIQTFDDIYAKILLVGEPGTFLFNTFRSTAKIFYDNELPTINELEFTFKRSDGTLFEFLNRDHSFTLKVTQLINKIGNANFSTRTGNFNTINPNYTLSSSNNNSYMQ